MSQRAVKEEGAAEGRLDSARERDKESDRVQGKSMSNSTASSRDERAAL